VNPRPTYGAGCPSPGARRRRLAPVLARVLPPVLALAGLLTATGCPLPQPLPDYQRGTTTAPRIIMDGIVHRESIIRVPAGCSTEPAFPLAGVQLNDPNTSEQVVARWFIDYDATDERLRLPVHEAIVAPPDANAKDPLIRDVPAYTFHAYSFDDTVGPDLRPDAAGVVHVVELVVSAEFDDALDPPNRAPVAGFETQTYRWVFVNVAPAGTVQCP